MSVDNGVTLRVAQWATGVVGLTALKAVIAHPSLELVGVYVYSATKAGRDAGDICGLPPTGIIATRNIDDIIAAKPDCVIYMPESTNLDHVCRLLESGINITTTRSEFYNPKSMNWTIRERVEAACRAGNSSIHGSGSSPGFITEPLPMVLTSLARRMDFYSVDEYANCLGGVVSEEMLTTTMGFGDTPEEFAKRDIAKRDEGFEYSLGAFAESIGLSVERFEVASEVGTALQPVKLGAGIVEVGRVGAQRIIVTGFHDGRPLVRFRANWYVTTQIEPHWDLPEDSGWRLRVMGDTPMQLSITFPVAPEDRFHAFAGLTAHRPVNAVHATCAAPAGIISAAELPRVIARFGQPRAVDTSGF